MSGVVLGGSFTSALTHFAGFGAAAILEDAGYRDLRLSWSDEEIPALTLSGVEATQAAAEVLRHAADHARETSWVQQITTVDKKAKEVEVGLFSPRIAAPETRTAWQRHSEERWRALDATQNRGWLDSMWLQAIGQPADWQFGNRDPQYDAGASRWEMKTRNRGEDFVRNRLSRLAREVAERTSTEALDGLTGRSLSDYSGGGANSRTGTGFAPPGPVDDVQAWCALWGISMFRLYQQNRGVAVTPGAWPLHRVHPSSMVLPMMTLPMSPAKIRRILRSRSFAVAAFGRSDGAADGAELEIAASVEQLRQAQIRGLVRFPIRKAGSASAPERMVLSGTFESV